MSKEKIILLIGKKGSGKSFIGKIIDEHFGFIFIHVEDWVLQVKSQGDFSNDSYVKHVFEMIERRIRKVLKHNNRIVFESTGITGYFDEMLVNLKRDFDVITIGIQANCQTCLTRIRNRNQLFHVKMKDDDIRDVNKMVSEKDFKTDFRINNESKNTKEVIEELKKILKALV